jgi:predicted nuclease of predicted toxin-antitoxin system
VVYEELRVSGKRLPFRTVAWLVHWTGHGVCATVGRFVQKDHVTDPEILRIARRENILVDVGGVK